MARATTTLERRSTEEDLLHGVARQGFRQLLRATRRGRRLAASPRTALFGLWRSGVGFARLACTRCEHQRMVTFSGKGHGFCPPERSAWVDSSLQIDPYNERTSSVYYQDAEGRTPGAAQGMSFT